MAKILDNCPTSNKATYKTAVAEGLGAPIDGLNRTTGEDPVDHLVRIIWTCIWNDVTLCDYSFYTDIEGLAMAEVATPKSKRAKAKKRE